VVCSKQQFASPIHLLRQVKRSRQLSTSPAPWCSPLDGASSDTCKFEATNARIITLHMHTHTHTCAYKHTHTHTLMCAQHTHTHTHFVGSRWLNVIGHWWMWGAIATLPEAPVITLKKPTDSLPWRNCSKSFIASKSLVHQRDPYTREVVTPQGLQFFSEEKQI
jgi:hypothetical protein